MVFRSKEHHVSQHMVRVSQDMVMYAMCGEVGQCCLRHWILLIARHMFDDVRKIRLELLHASSRL